MDESGTGCRFQPTNWTLILRARENSAELGDLLRRYRWPVYAYLRRKGYSPHEADDLTQGFLCAKVLEGNLLDRADRRRGRFRSFLLRSLQNHLIDELRKQSDVAVSAQSDPNELLAAEPSQEDDPDIAFDHQWAATLYNQALLEVEESCRQNGMARQWTVFEERLLRPVQRGCLPTAVSELMQRFELPSEQKVYSMLQTINRKIASALRRQVAATVDDPSEIEPELAEIRRLLESSKSLRD